jgi:putative transposase
MTTPACPSYAGYRFPAEIISHAVWLYFRFPLSLRMVDELLAARGAIVSYETVRQWALKFGQAFASQIRRRLPRAGDKWHLDEVVLTIAGWCEFSALLFSPLCFRCSTEGITSRLAAP